MDHDYRLWAYYDNEHVEVISLFDMFDTDCALIQFSDGAVKYVPATRLRNRLVMRLA